MRFIGLTIGLILVLVSCDVACFGMEQNKNPMAKADADQSIHEKKQDDLAKPTSHTELEKCKKWNEIKNEPGVIEVSREAKLGNPEAQLLLGMTLIERGKSKADITEYEWIIKAAKQGVEHARQYSMGYAKGNGIHREPGVSAKEYVKFAKKGLCMAQRLAAECYFSGNGVDLDLTKAFSFWKQAGMQGDSQSQYNTGYCYALGQGVEKNLLEAIQWWKKSAEQGNIGAQKDLGIAYQRGDGIIPKDMQQAVYWYTKAAEQGHAIAAYHLAEIYEEGGEIKQDYKKAAKWYRCAFEILDTSFREQKKHQP